jgi:hypothetical protein
VLGFCIVPVITIMYAVVCKNPEVGPQLKVFVAVVSVNVASVGDILVTIVE